jgi:manganese/zinc/iron transport system substrate-binding protein
MFAESADATRIQKRNFANHKSYRRTKMKFSSYLSICLLALVATGCTNNIGSLTNQQIPVNGSSPNPLKIVATTGQISSALTKITQGTDAEITLFCGPGVDPHSFSASTRDVKAMLDAELIVYNGFHLEAKLSEHLHDSFGEKSWSMASAFPERSRLDWVEDGNVDPDAPFDPHIWNHLPAWAECVKGMTNRLVELDPENAKIYIKNSAAYVDEIMVTHQWAESKLKSLPKDRRIIVSAHDAFNYFAEVYGMETLAVLGIGNDPEADIKTMREVAIEICEKKVPAIFMESITNPKVSQALKEACEARNWQVELVQQTLYSDDLGESAPQNTFLGAFRSNVEIISQSLNREVNP